MSQIWNVGMETHLPNKRNQFILKSSPFVLLNKKIIKMSRDDFTLKSDEENIGVVGYVTHG